MPQEKCRLSTIMIWVFILTAYIPMLTLFAMKDESRLFLYWVSVYWLIIFVIVRLPNISFVRLYESKFILYLCSLVILFLTCFFMIRYVGFSFNLNLARVYEVREQFSAESIPIVGYLFKWACYVIIPFLFSLFWIQKRWIALGCIVALQIFMFSGTGNKTFLFSLVWVVALMWALKKDLPLIYLTMGFSFIVIAGVLSYICIGDVWVSSLFTRRTLLAQPMQYFFYHDFFSQHPFVHLSGHSFFKAFSNYPYDMSPAKMIGSIYYGNPENNANTGLVGDAFMNFGFLGLIMWSMVTGMMMKLIDSLSEGMDIRVAASVIAMPIITLTNSALLTNLLTHGLAVALLVLYFATKSSFKFNCNQVYSRLL
nr:hypothetical protein [uncultured Desulfobacter sp.]